MALVSPEKSAFLPLQNAYKYQVACTITRRAEDQRCMVPVAVAMLDRAQLNSDPEIIKNVVHTTLPVPRGCRTSSGPLSRFISAWLCWEGILENSNISGEGTFWKPSIADVRKNFFRANPLRGALAHVSTKWLVLQNDSCCSDNAYYYIIEKTDQQRSGKLTQRLHF